MTTTSRSTRTVVPDEIPEDLIPRKRASKPPSKPPSKPRRVSVMQSVRKHWLLAVAPVVILTLFALVAGLARHPTYTAEARLNVGRIDVTSQAIPGFVTGTQSLAATYSRAVNANAVVQPVAKALGISADAVASRVSASPIPGSPLFRVQATGPSAAAAVELANRTTDSLIKYVANVNNPETQGGQLLDVIDRASVDLAQAKAKLRAANRAYATNPSAANSAAVTKADAVAYSAKLRLQTLSDAYRDSQQGVSQSEIVQVLNPAARAASDASSVFQKLLFVGLVGGLAVGLALATARANWRPRPTQ